MIYVPARLVFFRTSGAGVNHVGIYRGRGEFIHAATGGGRVMVGNLSDNYWQQRLVKFWTGASLNSARANTSIAVTA